MKASDIRRGHVLIIDGQPCRVMDFQHRTPGNLRAFVQVRLRNLTNGNTFDTRLSATEFVEDARLDTKDMQVMYRDANGVHVMDSETYDQFTLDDEVVGDQGQWMESGLNFQAEWLNGRPIAILLPATAELEVVETAPIMKTATKTASTKPAKLSNGVTIQVPEFIGEGERVRVNPAGRGLPGARQVGRPAWSAALAEGGLVLMALGLGAVARSRAVRNARRGPGGAWPAGSRPRPLCCWSLRWCLRTPWRPIADLVHLVEERVGPLFAGSTPAGLALVAALAGLGEEALFRGVLQPALAAHLPLWTAVAATAAAVRTRPFPFPHLCRARGDHRRLSRRDSGPRREPAGADRGARPLRFRGAGAAGGAARKRPFRRTGVKPPPTSRVL